MASVTGHQLIPSARRMITSLRDMGYDFAAAVADLIDNSIEARASKVEVVAHFMADDSWVRIADNGRGMSPAELREALRYGAEREYEDGDLGRFGLGLKTASMSQCQRLSIASRTSPERADIAAYCWDLQHILKSNKWEILPVERKGDGAVVFEPLLERRGTSVVWQRLDRLLGYDHPYGEFARKRLSSMCRDLEQHLAMVFHRFIGGEVRGRKVGLRLNGNEIRPWDPFVRGEPGTKALEPKEFKLNHEGVEGIVRMEPFLLPHQAEFSSPEAFRQASGPSSWNQQQGFYIYRADRMIQSGGWSRLRTQDEHTKLARVALMFPPKLDSAFKINVAKMRVQLPAQLREQIEEAIRPVIKEAQTRYRKTSKRHAGVTYETASEKSAGRGIEQPSAKYGSGRGANGQVWSLEEIEQMLMQAATAEERRIIMKVLARVREQLLAEVQ